MNDADIRPAPSERLGSAQRRFARVNATLPAGIQGFQMPPWTELTASVDALARVLLDHGLIDEQEFIDAKTLRLAELIDDCCEQAAQAKRAATGLVLPAPRMPA